MSLIFMFFYWIVFPSIIIFSSILFYTKVHAWTLRAGVILFGCFLLAGYAWIAVGDIWMADKKVNELCKKDGGYKVYEKVLSKNILKNSSNEISIPPNINKKESDEYYFLREKIYIKKDYPKIWKSVHRIIRSSDNKVMGESVRYTRMGGGLPGPWHESSYICPPISSVHPQLKELIFVSGYENE